MSAPVIILIVIGSMLLLAAILLGMRTLGVISMNAALLLSRSLAPAFVTRPRLTTAVAASAAATRAVLAAWVVYLTTFLLSDPDVARSSIHVIIVGASMLAMVPLSVVLRACKVSATKTVTIDLEGAEPVALLLRSFASDGDLERDALNAAETLSEEEEIARILRHAKGIGFVSLARPGQPFQELGADRVDLGARDWREVVSRLVSRAKVVVMRLADSEAVLWELAAVIQAGKLKQTLFLLPPITRPEGAIEYLSFVEKSSLFPGHPEFPVELEAGTRFLVVDDEGAVKMLKESPHNTVPQVILAPFLRRLGIQAPRTYLSFENAVPTMAMLCAFVYILIVQLWNRLD